MKKILHILSPFEWGLLLLSLIAILTAFFACGNSNYLYLSASLVGAVALVFVARGNPAGQALTILFSALYGYISFTFRYYGEMITYLGMTMPIALAALIAWLRHPFAGKRGEVTVNAPPLREYLLIAGIGLLVTAGMGALLAWWKTANLAVSILSVFTSWMAACLTVRRSPWYAAAYACNDVVLIVLWALASVQDAEYISMVVCFVIFLLNDGYGFFNWRRLQRRQAREQAQNA